MHLTPLIIPLLDSELTAPGAGAEAVGDSQGRSPHRCIFSPPGMNLKLPKYKEHDFRTPPMFLSLLPILLQAMADDAVAFLTLQRPLSHGGGPATGKDQAGT